MHLLNGAVCIFGSSEVDETVTEGTTTSGYDDAASYLTAIAESFSESLVGRLKSQVSDEYLGGHICERLF